MRLNSSAMLNSVRFFFTRFIYPFALSSGVVTQCTRFDRLMSNSDPRKMDMYIQVCSFPENLRR